MDRFERGTVQRIFTEFKGTLTEQYVLQQLISDVGVILYYYSTKNSKGEIALYIVNTRKEITNLLLQKLLYYIKGLSTAIEGAVIIPDPCEAWRYGPVFPTVYEKYKRFAKGEISINLSEEYTSGLLSDKKKHITDYVLDTFGIYNAWFLKALTHGEEPWKEARGDFLYWTVNGLLDILMYSYIYIVLQCIKNMVHLHRLQMGANSNSRMEQVHCCHDVLIEYR